MPRDGRTVVWEEKQKFTQGMIRGMIFCELPLVVTCIILVEMTGHLGKTESEVLSCSYVN